MRRALMICPNFAPSSNIGAKRSIRFARHLRQHGWEPLILTVDGSVNDGTDLSLNALLPPDLIIRRTYAGLLWPLMQELETAKAKARGREGNKPITGNKRKIFEDFSRLTLYWTPIDQLLPFVIGATREAIRFAKEERAEAIYVSSWPFSGLIVGALAARRLGLPLLLDLRDPWALDTLSFPRKPKLLQSIEARVEAFCIKHASRVLCNTREAARLYKEHYPSQAEKFFALHNGFDREIFTPSDATPPTESFTLVHFGTLSQRRNLQPLIEALQRFPQLRLIEYGVFHANNLSLADSLGVRDRVEERKQVPYVSSLEVLQSAHALLLVQSSETQSQIPAKLYDYLCAKRPILALTTNPEIGDILRETNAGVAVHNDSEAELISALSDLINGEFGQPDPEKIAAFDAVRQTQQLAEHLNEIARG